MYVYNHTPEQKEIANYPPTCVCNQILSRLYIFVLKIVVELLDLSVSWANRCLGS